MKEALKREILMANHFYGTFVGVWYETRDALKLVNWASSQGLTDITELDEIHTTIHYSKKGSKAATREAKGKIFTVETGDLELLGADRNILVVRVISEELEKLHNNMKEKYGLEYDYPEYKPHITIQYDFKGKLSDLELPNMTLTARNVKVTPNKMNGYKPKKRK